jgi:Carboxypeptidase regulatory-like domain
MFAPERQKSAFVLIFIAALVLGCEGQTASAGKYRIAGTVVSSTDGHPLSHARVILANVKNLARPFSVFSSEDGSFVFSGLPAGKYSLQGAKRGYLTRSYDQHEVFSTAIVTDAGLDTEHLVLRLPSNAYISGKVFDENGDPVRHANVMLYRVAHEEGTSQVQQNRIDNSDDLGAYELGPVLPGTYFIAVRGEPWYAVHTPAPTSSTKDAPPMQVDPALDSAYPTSYYGDTTDPDSATPIQVQAGDRVQADVHLAPAPSKHFLIRVPQGSVPQVQEIGLGGETRGVPVYQQRTDEGSWELSGLSQGKYQLSIAGAEGESTVRDLGAISEGQEIDATSAQPLGAVSIAVQIAGQNAALGQVNVGLRVPRGILRYWDRCDSKGVARLKGVAAGRYEVVGWDDRGRYAVSHVSVTGGELAGAAVELGAGTTAEIAVALVRGQAKLEGIVKRDDKPFPGAMVVLVPDNSNQPADLFRRDQTDFDGTFTLNAVAPGDYALVAIENGWDLEWSRPDVLAAYLKQARKIRVAAGSNGAIKIEEPVAVQQRQ